jgi:hypothetical protein
MAVCNLMVLGRRIEASYITVLYLGELVDWNEMKSKRSNMISLWNTHGYRTYLFGIELAELQVAPSVPPKWLEQAPTFYICLRSSNSEHCLDMVGVTVYLRDSHVRQS